MQNDRRVVVREGEKERGEGMTLVEGWGTVERVRMSAGGSRGYG